MMGSPDICPDFSSVLRYTSHKNVKASDPGMEVEEVYEKSLTALLYHLP